MSKIIQKLGLPELLDEINVTHDARELLYELDFAYDGMETEELEHNAKILLVREQQRRAMLEALIGEWKFIEIYLASNASRNDGFWYNEFLIKQNNIVKLIESITGKTWAEIKDLLEGV